MHAERTSTVSDFDLRDGAPEIETGVQFGDIDTIKQVLGGSHRLRLGFELHD